MADKRLLVGISLAIFATLIWSGNFIIARDAIDSIPPVTLAFYRWLTATILLIPFAWKGLGSQWQTVRKNFPYFFLTAVTGVTMFNTFVYIAGHYSTAINLALIGTTTSPIIAVILASILLKEKITTLRIIGIAFCVVGILLLISGGSMDKLLSFSFTTGDWWILAAAFSFAVYNTMVKLKPKEMNSTHFLFVCFLLGTILLLPFYLMELNAKGGFDPGIRNLSFILYLGLGTSVIAFLCWNESIMGIGAGRTALFGNLIPVFSTIEAVLWLGEKITWVHVASFVIVIVGLLIANFRKSE